MVSPNKDSIGLILSQRAELTKDDDYELVGIKPVNTGNSLTAGAHFIAVGAEAIACNDEGWLTSVGYSPHLRTSIGLGFIRRGRQRHGEVVRAVNLLSDEDIEVELCNPHFIDPDGVRLHD